MREVHKIHMPCPSDFLPRAELKGGGGGGGGGGGNKLAQERYVAYFGGTFHSSHGYFGCSV